MIDLFAQRKLALAEIQLTNSYDEQHHRGSLSNSQSDRVGKDGIGRYPTDKWARNRQLGWNRGS